MGIKNILAGGVIFILLSIKTRIETIFPPGNTTRKSGFLSYYPLKQGLKHAILRYNQTLLSDFYPSIH